MLSFSCLVLLSLTMVCADSVKYSSPRRKTPANEDLKQVVNYEYEINDYSGNEQSKKETIDGDRQVGEYKTLLPDGRRQLVTYNAGPEGFVANVEYEEDRQTDRAPYSAPALRKDNKQMVNYEHEAIATVYTTTGPVYETPDYTTSAPAPVYTESAPIYTESAPVYTESAPNYTESAPVYTESAPVYTESGPTYSAPAYSAPAPAYAVPAYSAPVYRNVVAPYRYVQPPRYSAPVYAAQVHRARPMAGY